MRFHLRFLVPIFASLGVLALIIVSLGSTYLMDWFKTDVEIRSRLVFNSIADQVATATASADAEQTVQLFDRMARDERLLAIGLCDTSGQLIESGQRWPAGAVCPFGISSQQGRFERTTLDGLEVLIASFPLPPTRDVASNIVVIHDLSFIERREWLALTFMILGLGTVGIVIAFSAIRITRTTLQDWLASMRSSLAPASAKERTATEIDPALSPVIEEIHQLLRDLDLSRSTAAGLRPEWTAETLRSAVHSELAGAEVVVVSNREPYIHDLRSDGTIEVRRPASGLVTALEPIVNACRGIWIAHGSGSADKEAVDERDHVAVPPNDPAYTLRRLWLSADEERGYYYGFANEGLWPLCHISYVRPVFREEDWQQYIAVNRRFAEAVADEVRTDSPLVLVQDYHLALVPRFIRELLPNAVIVTFWHIPWPNAEIFGICPWRRLLLDGLLAGNVVGFHTQLHCNNFIESADRFLECHIDREESTVSVNQDTALVRPYPISIEWPPTAMAMQPSIAECRSSVFGRYNFPPDTRLAVGVERLDFTKGIPDRFRAVGFLLERFPEWRGKFSLLQIAAPSRSDLPAYKALRDEAVAIANEINERFGTESYNPIHLAIEHTQPDDVFTLFRAAEICIVSSLHDGMNLVAKEFVASRDDEQGVLVLSTFAGASRELMEALIVNPFDARATAEAIDRALRMPVSEQRDRMQLMRSTVSENNVFYWAGRLLLDAARLRKRKRIVESLAKISPMPPKKFSAAYSTARSKAQPRL